ncbi:MAG: metallophosphoesterase [Deltaproteobacteria bacterium]|jgi:predicted MPP superfamily phosphohydrolase|nr:metallophosphoesterase [Deltaproteobacteria bacterium]
MFFITFALIITVYLSLSVVYPLPVGWPWKTAFVLLIFICVGRYAILRSIFGGLGGIETNKYLLYFTSFLQDLFIFLFLIAVLRDIICILSLPSYFLPGLSEGGILFRKALKGIGFTIALVSLAGLVSLWALYEAAKVPTVKRTEVTLDRLPPALDGLKIAILADLHICRFFDRPWVEEVVRRTNELDPDLILIPGDLVDGEVKLRAEDVEPLARLKSRYGKFFSVGNHEYYSQLPSWIPAFQGLGLQNLYNLSVPVNLRGTTLYLAGVTDPAAYGYDLPGPDLKEALKGVPASGHPLILLDHRPHNALENAKDGRVSLQLSGHTHGGLFPILATLTKRANRGYLRGWYEVNGLKLYVHPGTALWSGVPARIFNPSEITLLTLHSPKPEPK